MRSLPLRLSSVDGESLLGYIARYSHTFQFEPGDVVRALGLEPAAGRRLGRRAPWRLVVRRAARARRVRNRDPTEVLKGMLLCRYAGRAFDQVPGGAAERQVWIWCSRFCPPCLCEDGAWRLAWQLGWTTVCVRHQVLLRVRCPQCARVPEVGPRRRWPHDHRGLLSDPSRCWRRHRHALCRVNLAAADATSVADDMELLAAQRRIDTLLDGQLEPTLAGEQLAPPIYLRDLLALCNLLDRHGRVPDEAQPPVALRGRRLHDHPAELAAVLPGALALADLPDQEALADALRELADRRYHADGQTLTAARVGPVSATLKDALRRALTQTTWARATSRMGFDRGGHRRPDDLDDKLQARHVPQLFWADDYQRELAALFDFDYFTHWLGRRFCSVLLTRMLTPHDWHDAVRYLDLPERSSTTATTGSSRLWARTAASTSSPAA